MKTRKNQGDSYQNSPSFDPEQIDYNNLDQSSGQTGSPTGQVGIDFDLEEFDLDAYHEESIWDAVKNERRISNFDRALDQINDRRARKEDESKKNKQTSKIKPDEPKEDKSKASFIEDTDQAKIDDSSEIKIDLDLSKDLESNEESKKNLDEEFKIDLDLDRVPVVEIEGQGSEIEEGSASEGDLLDEKLEASDDEHDSKVGDQDQAEDSSPEEDASAEPDSKPVEEQVDQESGLESESTSDKEVSDEKIDDEASLIEDDQEVETSEEEKLAELGEVISQQTQQFNQPLLTDEMIGQVNLPSQKQVESNTSKLEEFDSTELDKEADGDTVVEGATWLTAGSIISRILGAIYIIPWAAWLGADYSQAAALYSVGYKYYALFLAIATAGIPSAISKQMAYYQSKKEFKAADQLFKSSAILMILSGIISGAALYFLAPTFAAQSPTNNPESAILVIRSLVPALLILPLVSLFRGYFQGFNDMKPSAVSQIIEQVVRVIYILAATYAILRVYDGTVTSAVVHSTFAAFVGAAACFIYLIILFIRRYPTVRKLIKNSQNSVELDFAQSIKIIIKDSIPFILLGSGITIMQVIDTLTFKPILMNFSALLAIEINDIYAAFSLNVDKLSMILVSIGVALSTSLVPVVTEHFSKGDREKTAEVISQVILVYMFVMLPAAFGMSSVADNLYAFFYSGGSDWETRLLITGSLTSVILGLYSVLSMVLQSMGFRRMAMRFLFIGILAKLVLQVPLVAMFKGHGALISTALGLLVSSLLMWVKIKRELDFDERYMKSQLNRILLSSLVMGVVTFIWNRMLNGFIGGGRWLCLVKVILVAILGVVIYIALSGLVGTLKLLLGDKYQEIQEKMRLF